MTFVIFVIISENTIFIIERNCLHIDKEFSGRVHKGLVEARKISTQEMCINSQCGIDSSTYTTA